MRAALPTLVRFRLNDFRPSESASVDDVFLDGDDAIADWHSAGGRGVAVLRYRNARWWLVGNGYETQDQGRTMWMYEGINPIGCAMEAISLPPDADYLRHAFNAANATIALWSAHGAIPTPEPGKVTIIAAVPSERFCFEHSLGTTEKQSLTLKNIDGYRAHWSATSSWSPDISHPISRAPTDAEMSAPGADAVFFFSATVGKAPVAIGKTTLDVWCPFVLDPGARYSLAITGGEPIVGPIDGTMTNNVLHFELPEFTAKPGTYLQGEIDVLRKLPGS